MIKIATECQISTEKFGRDFPYLTILEINFDWEKTSVRWTVQHVEKARIKNKPTTFHNGNFMSLSKLDKKTF